MRASLVWPALLVMAVSSCASGPRIGTGTPRWLRVESAHFIVHTDLPEASARARAALLEQLLAAYLQHGWDARGELALRLHVVLFASSRDFGAFVGRDDVAGFYSEALFEPWVVLPDRQRAEGFSELRHELSHHLAFMAMPYQPPWLAEGLATYFETARFDAERGFVIGGVPLDKYALLMREGLLPARELLAVDAPPTHALYATAWLLVHYLISEREAEFARYQALLAAGRSHGSAWSEAFPELDDAQVDVVLREYAGAGAFANFTRRVSAVRAPVRVEHMAQAEEHALSALLYELCMECGPAAQRKKRESLRRALALEPQQLEANALELLSASTTAARASALRRARELVAHHPDAWLAWLAVARLSWEQESPESTFAAAQRVIAIAPHQAHARMLAAHCYLRVGRPVDALREAAEALRLRPTHTGLLVAYAHLLAELSQCEALDRTLEKIRAHGHARIESARLLPLERARAACRSAPARP